VSAIVADDLAPRTEQLLAMWSELSMRHVALGTACACGMGGISLRLEDFELDIVDYLHDAAARSDEAAVVVWGQAELRAVADSGEVRRMRDLIDTLRHPQTPEAVRAWLLLRLEKTLRSYAELHGPRLEG
jgi:hypothetical protein